MANGKMLEKTATALVIVGALNIGLVSFANMDIIGMLAPLGSMATQLAAGAVGLSALYVGYNTYMKK